MDPQATNYLELLSDILRNSIQDQLTKLRPSRGYDGQRKPVRGGMGSTNNRIYTGKLYNSVEVDFVQDNEGNTRIQLGFPGAPEWRFVDQGRRGKKQNAALKYPPLSVITTWSNSRGLPQFRDNQGRFLSNNDRAFLVQRSIGEYGIFPTRFVQEGFNEAREKVVYYLGEYGKRILEDIIERKIIITSKTK
jgi:hypothetical protein